MKKYQKFIAITLILIMLINIIDYKKVNADMDNITKAGLIAFLITMNIYNLATNTTNAVMTLFNDFWSKKTNSEQNDFVNNFKNVWKNSFTSGIVSVVSMPYINNWIRENFSKGYGNISIDKEEKNEVLMQVPVANYNQYELIDVMKPGSRIDGLFYYDGSYRNCKLILNRLNTANDPATATLYYNGESRYIELKEWNGRIFPCVGLRIRLQSNGSVIGGMLYNSFGGYAWANATINYNLSTYKDVVYESENINYYAGQAVDYPMERDVEDKYIPLPVPDVGMGIPGLDYDVGENKVFDGTVDDFINGALNNQDYLDSTIDKLLEAGYSTSHPIVDVDNNTITWPKTGSITYPDTGVIDYPDVTIPEGVEEGIGETNSILQGIGNFLESIFAAPIVELDLSPLTNVNLKEKFPFCLPFDLSSLITGLKVDDAEVPNIELNFEVLNDEYTIPLNFELFNDWAIIVNWFVLILFIVGLIMISRKLIGG